VVHVAPEVLDSSPDPLDPPPETLDDDSESTTYQVCVVGEVWYFFIG